MERRSLLLFLLELQTGVEGCAMCAAHMLMPTPLLLPQVMTLISP